MVPAWNRDHGHVVICNPLFRLAVSVGGLSLMAQSYVGKHAISKGIGRAIRKFVAFAFSAHVLGHRRRACAVPDIQKRASHLVRGTLRSFFPAADAICWKTITWEIQKLRKLVQCCNGKVGRQPPAWVGGEEATPSAM